MSFSCPHFDIENDRCLLLKAECVAGRPGCVLRKTSVFFVPAEERLNPPQPMETVEKTETDRHRAAPRRPSSTHRRR